MRDLGAFINAKHIIDFFAQEGLINEEGAKANNDAGWKIVEAHFGPEPRSAPVQEAIDWLKDKAMRDKIMFIDTKPIEDPAQKEAMISIVRTVAAPYALAGISKLGNGGEDELVVVADLIDQESSPMEMIMSIAHERGHETINTNTKGKALTSDTHLVFQEFFPILEAQRVYSGMSETERATIRPSVRSSYEVDPQLKGRDVTAQIAGSQTPVRFDVNDVNMSLIKGYAHSLEENQRYQRLVLKKELTSKGMDTDAIRAKLKEIQLFSTPVFTLEQIELSSPKSSN